MNNTCGAWSPSFPWARGAAVAALLIGACSGATSSVDAGFVCTPACPASLFCGAGGCTPFDAGAPVDLTVVVEDGGLCGASACGGSTPFCVDGVCVPCALDADCGPGQVCQSLGRARACVPGCTDDSRCAIPGSDGGPGAPRCCNGQCVDPGSDGQNCGGCGIACLGNHAQPACRGGACTAGACQPGYADCNNDPTDGCETNVHSDPAHCTACGKVCAFPDGIAGCSDGCYLTGCDFGHDDCNADPSDGCETSTLSDPRNCGGCGVSCAARAHATVACQNANCQLTRCDNGWSDCDGVPDNGCETDTSSDLANCGQCGNVCGPKLVCKNSSCTCQGCAIPNARTRCVNLVCTFDQCLPGFGDCNGNLADGCETDLTADIANCGACGAACPKGNYCVSGACSLQFAFQKTQVVDGQTVTCSAVINTLAYTECDDFQSNGGYLANGVSCAMAWNTQNSPFSDNKGLCASLTGGSKYEGFYLCNGGGTRATWNAHAWGKFVDNSFTQHVRCYF